MPLTYTIFVKNDGPAAATNVVLNDTLSGSLSNATVSATQGTCSATPPLAFSCALVALAPGAAATVTITVVPTATGSATSRATVQAAERDPAPSNNASTETTTIVPNAPSCPAPPPDILSSPSGIVRAGDAFTVSWSDVYGPTDADGLYHVQLAAAGDFGAGSLLAELRTRNLSLSFPTTPGAAATLFFRVSSVAGCGTEGSFSRTVAINVSPNPPSVVVTQAQAPVWVAAPDGPPPTGTVRFRTWTAHGLIRPDVDQDQILIVNRPGAQRALADPLPKVTVFNPGRIPIFLVPSVAPGGAWLTLDPLDFSATLKGGERRTIKLAVDASRITSADYPLPIFTILTIATAGGTAVDRTEVKVFYTEGATANPGSGRGFLANGVSSFVIPTAVHKVGQGNALFTSDGWIRNLSPDPADVVLFATPSGADGQLQALRVSQSIPGFATLRLFDFVQSLFGSTDLAGPVEVRSSTSAQLSVRVTADGVPGRPDGTLDVSQRYGTEIPVFGSGTGTGAGRPPLVVTGIKSNEKFRLNLILAETSGTPARVRLRLFDSAGAPLGSADVDVAPLGNTQFALLDKLGVSRRSRKDGRPLRSTRASRNTLGSGRT